MKKYLISEELLDRLMITCPIAMIPTLEALKPIEPLSRGDIDKIYERIDDYYSASWTHKFARDIEAHILGDKK